MAEYRFFGTFRFALAICVVLQHFGSQIAPAALRDTLNPLAIGNCAVLAFFVLSGFIISEAGEVFYKGRPNAFLLNRCLRLVPPFIVSMTATVGVYVTIDALDNAMIDDALLSTRAIALNYASIFPGVPFPGRGGNPAQPFIIAVWALRIEFLFYIGFALCLALSRRLGHGKVLAAASVLAASGFILSLSGHAPKLFEYAPYFVLGVALFHARKGGLSARWICAAALVAIVIQFRQNDVGSPIAALYDRPAQFVILGTMLAILVALSLVRLAKGREIDQRLGDLSYSIYLNHAAVQVIFKFHGPEPSVLSFLLAIAITIFYSAAMLALTEPPLRLLRDQVRGANLLPSAALRRSRQAARAPQANQ